MWENTINILQEYGEKFVELYKQNLENSGRKATGNLINSISTRIETGDYKLEVFINLEDYYQYVENGRSAGSFPPVDKIKEWIQAKPILPREENGKLPTEEQLAFLIGRKIQREGFEGTHDLQKTKDALQIEFETRIQEALKEDFKKEFVL